MPATGKSKEQIAEAFRAKLTQQFLDDFTVDIQRGLDDKVEYQLNSAFLDTWNSLAVDSFDLDLDDDEEANQELNSEPEMEEWKSELIEGVEDDLKDILCKVIGGVKLHVPDFEEVFLEEQKKGTAENN
jgi:hypothetical protein